MAAELSWRPVLSLMQEEDSFVRWKRPESLAWDFSPEDSCILDQLNPQAQDLDWLVLQVQDSSLEDSGRQAQEESQVQYA